MKVIAEGWKQKTSGLLLLEMVVTHTRAICLENLCQLRISRNCYPGFKHKILDFSASYHGARNPFFGPPL